MPDFTPYELIDHTADVGFRIRGRTLQELFRNAALCLFEHVGVTEGVARTHAREIHVHADGFPPMLRSWLSELLYVSYVGEKLVLVDVEILDLDEHEVRARVTGEPYDETRHERHPEVKAVTWHGLKVERVDDLYQAEVILDL